jgi:tetratricopeptide (TPR) repeat protein
VTYFEAALTALQHFPDSPERRTQAIDLRFDLRLVLPRLGVYARILPLLQEAIALAEANHGQARLGRAYRSMIEQCLNMDDPARALDASQRALALATHLDDVALQMSTRATLARVYGNYGDYRQAVDLCRHVVATLPDDMLPQLSEAVGPSARRTRAYAAWSLAELGAFAEGLVHGSEALQYAQAASDVFSLVIALWSTG